jgi:hypothetical protein
MEKLSLDLRQLDHELHALAPKLPIELSEVASAEAGGSKAAWINGMFAYLAHTAR